LVDALRPAITGENEALEADELADDDEDVD
jgi:hypothetical protein